MPTIDDKDAALAILQEKESNTDLLGMAGRFAKGAGAAIASPFTEAARVGGEMFPEAAMALGIQPPRSTIAPVPSHAPTGTLSYDQMPPAPTTGPDLVKEALMANASMLPPVMLGQGLYGASQAWAPTQGPNGPVPPSGGDVAERLGGAAVGIGFGAAGTGLGISRFRPSRPPMTPGPTGAVPADFEMMGPPQLGAGEIASPAPPPEATGLPSGPLPNAPRQLPRGTAELTRSKVLPGFTPIEQTYNVQARSVGAKEFNQGRAVRALSEEEAVQKVRDELDQVQPGISKQYEFQAKGDKKTARDVPQAETSRMATGEPEPAPKSVETGGIRRMEKTVEAMRREEANQAKPAVTPRLPKPIRLASTVEEGRGIGGRQEPSGAADTPRKPAAGETAPQSPAVSKGDTVSYPGIGEGTVARTYIVEVSGNKRLAMDIRQDNGNVRKGLLVERATKVEAQPSVFDAVSDTEKIGRGKSILVREPTATEAETMKPGETMTAGNGDVVTRLSDEAERRVASRRGAGGGPTSFGEERGPDAPERRAAPGRRITDKQVKSAGSEGEKRLASIAEAKTHSDLVRLYRDQHKADPPPGIATKALREELNREAGSIVKGAKQALEPDLKAELAKEGMKPSPPEKPGPKSGAAAEAARAYAEQKRKVDVIRESGFSPAKAEVEKLSALEKTFRSEKTALAESKAEAALRSRLPAWVSEAMLREGKNPDRLMNDIDIAQYRDQMTSEEVSYALGESKTIPASAAAPVAETAKGRPTKVKTPSEDFDVQYEEVPISSLKTSHNALNFEPNREYPVEQQRDYTRNKIEQGKVMRMARDFNPDYLLSDTPTSTDGPPIVTPEGHVIGGNARTMSLVRGLSEGKIKPGELQAAVRASGAKFGIEGAGSKPGTIIVRRTSAIEPERISAATKALNEDFKMAVDPISDAVARARNLSGETVDWISGVLNDAGPDATVRAAIFDDKARLVDLMKKLSEDHVIVSSELPNIVDPSTGKLTPEGTRLIETALVGRVIRSPKMIREMPAGLKNQVSSAVSQWVRGETFPSEWRLNNDLVNGLWLHHVAEKAGKSIDMMLEPQLLPDPFLDAVRDNKVAIALARWFEDHGGKPNALRTALGKFNAHASDSVGSQESLGFFEKKNPHQAANDAFGLKLSPDDYGTGDGIVYLHAGVDLGFAFEKVAFRLSKKAKQLRDVIFIPKRIREPFVQGESFSAMLERVRRENSGDRWRASFADAWQKLVRFTVTNSETRRYPHFHEQLDQWNVHAATQLEKAANDMAEVVHPMLYFEDPVTGALRRRNQTEIDFAADRWMTLVTLRDMVKRAELGLKTPIEEHPSFANLSKADRIAAVKAELAAAEKNTSPAVKKSVENWIKLFKETRDEMVRRGKLSPEDRIGAEYMPNVMHDFSWKTEKQVASAGPSRIREAVRGYTKQAVGHARLHDVNPVRAGLQHLTNVYLDNLLDDFSHSVGQTWDHWPQLWKEIQKQAKERGVAPDVVAKEIGIPDEFEVYQVGGKRKFMWDPNTVSEYIVQKVISQDPDLGLRIKTAADMRDFLLAELGDKPGSLRNPANRPAYLVPKAISGALKQFREPRGELEALVSSIGRGMTTWKALTLLSVWVPYSLRNLHGDFTGLISKLPGRGPLPGLLPLVKHGPTAVRDMVLSATRGVTSEMLQKAQEVGVSQNTRAVAEMSDLRVHKELREFLRPRRAKILRPLDRAYEALTDALGGLMIFDSTREGTLRYAAWKYMVEDLKFPEKRAETLTSEIVGNYRVVDRMTKLMRRSGMMPFPVWIRQMVPGWTRWATGARLGRYFERPELYETSPSPRGKMELSVKVRMEVARRAEVRGIPFHEALASLREEAAIPPPNAPRPSATPPPGVRPEDWQYAHAGRYPRGTAAAILGAVVVPQLMLYWWNNIENKEKNDRIDQGFRNRNAYMILPGVQTYDGRPAVIAVQSGIDATITFFGFGDPAARLKKFHDAMEKGPQEAAKAAMEQIGESAATTAASVGDLFGPPLDVAKSVIETPFDVAKENMKPEEKRDWGRLLDRKYQKLYKDIVPNIVAEPLARIPGADKVGLKKGDWTKAAKRQDLEGIPDWMQGVMAQYPWGGLLYVPKTPNERKRQRAEK